MPMVPAMQVLVLWGLIRSIGATTGPVFQAVGRPRILTHLQLAQLILLAVCIYPLTARWGILGTSIAVVLASLGANMGAAILVVKVTKCGIWPFWKRLAFPLAGAGPMIGLLNALKTYCFAAGIAEFLLLVILGGLAFLGVILLIDKRGHYKMYSLIKGVVLQLQKI